MTKEELSIIEKWIIENVDACDVPSDEGNTEALIWNLVQLARYGRPYTSFSNKINTEVNLKQ